MQLFSRRYATPDFTDAVIRQRVLSGYQYVNTKSKEERNKNRCQNSVSVTYTPIENEQGDHSPEAVLKKMMFGVAMLPICPTH